MQLFQLQQYKFEHHQTLHPRSQNCQRQGHLHRNFFLHLLKFQAFQCCQGFDASEKIPHFHLTYKHSK